MIHRAPHDKEHPYFQVSRATAQDDNLSARALGVLAYLLSKPDTWEPTVEDICRRFADISRDYAYKIITEILIPLRYAKRTQQREKGKIVRWLVEIYEKPHPSQPDLVNAEIEPHPSQPDLAEPHPSPPDLAETDHRYNREVHNTEKKDKTERKRTRARKKSSSGKKAEPIPLAIAYIRELTKLFPPTELWPRITELMGADFDRERLRDCYLAWVARGFKKTNYSGWLFDWFKNGIPEQGVKNASNGHQPPAQLILKADPYCGKCSGSGLRLTDPTDAHSKMIPCECKKLVDPHQPPTVAPPADYGRRKEVAA